MTLETAYKKRKQWFINRIGKRIYRPPLRCDCQHCIDGHINGILISDETHADYLHSCENELGIRYNDNKLQI